MKVPSYCLLLGAMIMWLLAGCSDNATVPTSPTDQPSQSPASFEKPEYPTFTFIDFPIAPPVGDPPILRGRTWQIKNWRITERFVSADPMVNGIMVHNLSTSVDAVTGEGPCHGSWTLRPLDPAATGGGYWEGTYTGYRSRTADPLVFVLPLKSVGHGKGGTIQGWQTFSDATLLVRADDPATYPLPTSWSGTGEGFSKPH